MHTDLILDHCSEYTSDSSYVYASSGLKHEWIVIMKKKENSVETFKHSGKIVNSTETFMFAGKIVNQPYVEYTGLSLCVVKIFNKFNVLETLDEIKDRDLVKFKIGGTVEKSSYFKNVLMAFYCGVANGKNLDHNITTEMLHMCCYNGVPYKKYNIVNGKLEGKYEEYTQYFDVPIIVCTYKNGKLDGEYYKYYSKKGNPVEYVYVYSDGVLKKGTDYRDSGKIKNSFFTDENDVTHTSSYTESEIFESEILESKFQNINGRMHGDQFNYYNTGEIREVASYVNGIKIKHLHYYKNGNTKRIWNFENSKRHGVNSSYYENGNPEFEAVYDNDNIIAAKQYNKNGEEIDNLDRSCMTGVHKIQLSGWKHWWPQPWHESSDYTHNLRDFLDYQSGWFKPIIDYYL